MKTICGFLLFFTLTNLSAQNQSGKNFLPEIDSILNSYCTPGAPGMGLLIVQEGEVVYKNTGGIANLEYNIPITDSTVFNIASVSKQFTAFAALLAEQEGKLSFEDNITKYLPEMLDLPYEIKVKHLANHTHGLPNISDLSPLLGYGASDARTHAESIQTTLKIRSANFKPGEIYQYGNTGFSLLAEILARVYQQPFSELLQQRIFEPLGMKSSRVVTDADLVIPNRAEPYTATGDGFAKMDDRSKESGSSNVYTTLNDMGKWLINYQSPNLGSREIFDTMEKSTVLGSGEISLYGYGLQTEKIKGLDCVFHGGGTGGYRAYVFHVPAQQFSVIMLGNLRSFDTLLAIKDITDLVFADIQVIDTPEKTTCSASELEAFTGVYKLAGGNYSEITTDGKHLFWGNYGMEGAGQLELIGDDKFNIPYIPTASLTFSKNSFSYRIADFTYIGEKVELNPPGIEEMEAEKFAGTYYNEAFGLTYHLVFKDGKLSANHSINGEIPLFPLDEDSFYSYTYYFGELDFVFDKSGKTESFILSGMNMENLEFKKLN